MVNCLVCGKLVSQSGSFVFTRSYCGLSCAIIDNSSILLLMSVFLSLIEVLLLFFDTFNLIMLVVTLLFLGLSIYGRKKRVIPIDKRSKYDADGFSEQLQN